MTTRDRIRRAGEWAFLAGVATSAWIGVGMAFLATGRDFGAGVQPAYAAFGLAAAAALLTEADFRRRLADRRFLAPLWWLALVALLLSALGLRAAPTDVPAATALARWARQVIQWGAMAAVALVTAHRLAMPGARRPFATALAAGVLFQALYGSGQVWHFHHPSAWFGALERWATSNPAILSGSEELYLGHAFTGIPRVRGTACEPLYLGNAMLAAVPLFLALVPGRRRWWLPAAAGTALLLATWSRGAWLGAVGAAAIGAVLVWRTGRRPARRTVLYGAMAAAGAAGLLALLAGPESLLLPLDRLRQSLVREDWSNLTRLHSMTAAWRAFLLSPWVGVGWGQFGYHFPLLTDPEGLQSQFDWPVVNNLPLKILAETGLVGFGVFAASAAALGRRVLRACRPGGDVWTAAAAAAVAGVWIQLLSFSQYNLPHIWVALGVLLAAAPAASGRDA